MKRSLEDGGDAELPKPSSPVFALFKPRPMITDLTKGPMAEVARRMCPEAPPKPVGQLDRYTTGLMIFTLDGQLTCHLNGQATKTYRAWYEGWRSTQRSVGELTDAEVQRLLEGVHLSRDDGFAAFQHVERLGGVQQKSVWHKSTGEEIEKFQYSADVRIKCGKFHVVKRLFMSVGKSVVRLERLSVGQLSLDDCGLCAPGDFAELSQQQIDRLWQDPAPVQPKKGTESQSEV